MQNKMVKINFAGVQDNSTIDYPRKLSAVVYLCGCPYRCPWCQNPELVLNGENCRKADSDEIIKTLKKNFLIQAVCITGGEPLMQEETIKLLKRIKEETNLLTKMDTNSYYPERLKKTLPYLDFLTTDLKAPLNEKYGIAIGLPDQWREVVGKIRESLSLIKAWGRDKEARTTIVPEIIDEKKDIVEIAEIVEDTGFKQYTLQQFRAEKTLNPEYEKLRSPNLKLMRELGKTAKERLPMIRVQIVTQQNGFEEII